MFFKRMVGDFPTREAAMEWAEEAYGRERPDLSWCPVTNGKGNWSLEVTTWPLD
jgi:hypothetical protein